MNKISEQLTKTLTNFPHLDRRHVGVLGWLLSVYVCQKG
jgi:hypothetical protein